MCCFGSVRSPLALINSWIFRRRGTPFWGWGIQAFLIAVISTLFIFRSHTVILCNSLFDRDHLMFCKPGILIFIVAENNYSIYAHAMLIKTPLLHQSFGPSVSLSLSLFLLCLSLSLPLSLFLANALEREARWAHCLARASKALPSRCPAPLPAREGARCPRAAVWALRTGLYWLPA